MAGETNFSPWDTSQTNMENDAAYASDSTRVNGGANGSPWQAPSCNKTIYQSSLMCAALAQMLVNAGLSPVDGTTPFTAVSVGSNPALTALIGVLENIITTANFNGSISLSANGYIKLPSLLGGLIIQWGTQSYGGGGASANPLPAQTFPITFPNAVFTMVANSNSISTNMVWLAAYQLSTSGFTLTFSTAGAAANAFTARWVAIGY